MAWLPSFGKIDLQTTFDPKERTWIVTLAYLGTLWLLLLLAFSVHNFVQFLVRQSRWKVLPLLFFYTVTATDLILRIYILITVVGGESIFLTFFPLSLKLIIGLSQIWTIVELTVRVKQCIYALKCVHQPNSTLTPELVRRSQTVAHLQQFNQQREIGIKIF